MSAFSAGLGRLRAGSSLDTAEPLLIIRAGRGLGGLIPVTGQNGLLGHFFHSAVQSF